MSVHSRGWAALSPLSHFALCRAFSHSCLSSFPSTSALEKQRQDDALRSLLLLLTHELKLPTEVLLCENYETEWLNCGQIILPLAVSRGEMRAVSAVISSATLKMCFSGHIPDSWDETRGKRKNLHYCKFLGILISALNTKYYFVASYLWQHSRKQIVLCNNYSHCFLYYRLD